MRTKKKLHSHVTGSHQPFRKIHEGFPFCGKKKKSSGYTVRLNVHECVYMYVYTHRTNSGRIGVNCVTVSGCK